MSSNSNSSLSTSAAGVGKWLYEQFLKLFIYPSIWTAVAIGALAIYSQQLLGWELDWRPALFSFAVALIPYNLDRIIDTYVQEIPEQRAQNYFRNSAAIILLVLAAVVTTGILLYQANPLVRKVSIAGIIPLLYGVPFFPWPGEEGISWKRIKDIPGSKAWIVAGIITYAVVALPWAFHQVEFNMATVVVTWFLFICISSNSHIFDVRDVESDRKKGVITLPLLVGIFNARLILTSLNIIALGMMIFAWSQGILSFDLAAIIFVLINLIYIWTLSPQTPRNFYTIFIDGVFLVPPVLHWLLPKSM